MERMVKQQKNKKMASHKLGLNILDTINTSIFKIIDESVYSDIVPFNCPKLLITAPGFQYSFEVNQALLTKGFNLTLTACDLGMQKKHCESVMNELPDGIYAVKYSVAPSEYVFIEVAYLRTSKIEKQIQQMYCDLSLSCCNVDRYKENKILEIYNLEAKLRVAKAKVNCGDFEKGMFIFNDVVKSVSNIDCKSCR